MARRIVAGNWKMNLVGEEAFNLVNELNERVKDGETRVVLFPPSLFVQPIARMKKSTFDVGVQNFNAQESGAYTGEISIPQVKSAGGQIGLIGHSERREYYGETNDILKEKVDAAIANNFEFIFCCGEPLSIREKGTQAAFVEQQLEESLFHLNSDQIRDAIVAYEPIWAIGTGKTASSEQAEAMHADIRSWIADKYSSEIAESVSILYGGSCNPGNARELFACPNIDGGLIGGASLKAKDFCAIIDSF